MAAHPACDAWPWHFAALFSNSALAHQLDRCEDWAVLYFHRDSGPELRQTVVTETRGPLAGRRVVRGRETDCAVHYGEAHQMMPLNAQASDGG